MADLARLLVNWTGWDGAPGVNVLHFSPGTAAWSDETAQALHNEITGAYLAMVGYWPPPISAEVDTTIRVIDSATGEMKAIYTAPVSMNNLVGTGTGGALSRATMLCAQLRTSVFLRGRQVRGRIFIGPLANEAITSAGEIAASATADLADAFQASISGLGTNLCVWSRPVIEPVTGVVIHAGSYGDVTGVTAMRKPAVLRSRRD